MTGKLFCFGYGYCCDFLAGELMKKDWAVAGTTRDRDKFTLMRAQGIRPYLFEAGKPLQDPALFFEGVTHLLVSTPPDDDGDPAFVFHAEDVRHIPGLKWIGYLSATSVYGDRDGGWVDEMTEPRPSNKRGSRRLKAEKQWAGLQQKYGLPVHIFRVAGIYGPGRSALDSVRAGHARRIEKPGHAFSRIHVADIVQVLMASMSRPVPGSIYNLCDDVAAPSHEVIKLACELLERPVPPLQRYDEIDMSPMSRSFYADNKRIRNDKIKDELGINLLYPDYDVGLRACLAAESSLPGVTAALREQGISTESAAG